MADRLGDIALAAFRRGVTPAEVRETMAALRAAGYSHEEAVQRLRCTVVNRKDYGETD